MPKETAAPQAILAFGIDAFKVTNENGAEVGTWGEAGTPHFLGVELLAGGFGELVDVFGF